MEMIKEGVRARVAGIPVKDCPYTDPESVYLWVSGWRRRRAEVYMTCWVGDKARIRAKISGHIKRNGSAHVFKHISGDIFVRSKEVTIDGLLHNSDYEFMGVYESVGMAMADYDSWLEPK